MYNVTRNKIDLFKKNNISRVQKFQNRVARITTQNFDFNTSGISLVKSLGWLNIKQRMQFLACMLMHKRYSLQLYTTM